MAQGAIISRVSHGHSINIEEVTGPGGEIRKEGSVKVLGVVLIELGDEEWLAMVDLDEGKVLSLIEMTPPLIHRLARVPFIAPGLIIVGILILIGLLTRNRRAGAVAGIASIVLGLTGLLGVTGSGK